MPQCQRRSGRVLHNQPLLWTGPRRVVSLLLFHVLPARRVARHRTSSVMTLATLASKPLGTAGPLASDWARTGVLWAVRWVVILPFNWLMSKLNGDGGTAANVSGDLLVLFLILIVGPPLVETVVECVLPYTILRKLRGSAPGVLFIITSAALMSLLHLISLIAILDSAITGAFIAFVYAAAARRGQKIAFVHAFSFHSAINLIGWLMLLGASTGA